MNTEPPDGTVPSILLRVTDPVLWLENHDRDIELRDTVKRLLREYRWAEAVLCLESYIGRTAPIRAQVDGWDEDTGWPNAVTLLHNDRTGPACRAVLSLLRNTKSIPRRKLP